MFTITDNDSNNIKHAKTELNLALQANSMSYDSAYILFNIIKELENPKYIFGANIDDIKNGFNKLIERKVLTPINLDTEIFKTCTNEKFRCSKRYHYIQKNDNDKYIYMNAYRCKVRASYDIKSNSQLELKDASNIEFADRVYLTKGGVVTGEYIQYCYIKSKLFIPKEPIKLDCCKISFDIHQSLYTIDHRSIKLKALMEFYNVPILINENIEKIDIRKFKKL